MNEFDAIMGEFESTMDEFETTYAAYEAEMAAFDQLMTESVTVTDHETTPAQSESRVTVPTGAD